MTPSSVRRRRPRHINLTAVSQNSRELTEQAVVAVVERLDGGRTEHRKVVATPHLVVGGTTGPPAGLKAAAT